MRRNLLESKSPSTKRRENTDKLDLLNISGYKEKIKECKGSLSLRPHSPNIKQDYLSCEYSEGSSIETSISATNLLLKPKYLVKLFHSENKGRKYKGDSVANNWPHEKTEMKNSPHKSRDRGNYALDDKDYVEEDYLLPRVRPRAVFDCNASEVSDQVEQSDSESVSSVSTRCSIIYKPGESSLNIPTSKTFVKPVEPAFELAKYAQGVQERKIQNERLVSSSSVPYETIEPEVDLCKLNIRKYTESHVAGPRRIIKERRFVTGDFRHNVSVQFGPCGDGETPPDVAGEDILEIDLKHMGFSADNPINWEDIHLPKKRELHKIIHHRLCNYINPDIILIIDKHEFRCHRLVLQSYSTYFDDINNLESPPTIIIKEAGVTKEAFISIYAWMLSLNDTGYKYITRQNVLEILIASQVLKIRDLEEQCLALVDSKDVFSEEDAFFLYKKASIEGQAGIKELMAPRVQKFFLPLVSSKEFLDLQLDDLCTFLSSNYIIVHSEIEVFMSAARWLLYDWNERRKHLPQVMTCIRFGLMNPSELVDIRKNPESPEFLTITEDPNIQKFIDDGMAYSIESALKGATADHEYRCQLLGLRVPQPRNWASSSKYYKSYGEFIEFLHRLRTNTVEIISKETLESEGIRPALTYPIHYDEEESTGSCYRADESLNSLNAGIPSMSDLLVTAKKKHVLDKRLLKPRTDYVQNSSSTQQRTSGRIFNSSYIEERNKSPTADEQRTKFNFPRTIPKYKEPLSLKGKAASIIQAAYRGYRVRQIVNIKTRISQRKQDESQKVRKMLDEEKKLAKIVEEQSRHKTVQKSTSDSDPEVYSSSLVPPSSLHFPHSQTILIFGGLDPLQAMSQNNNGSIILRYSVEVNQWETVGILPKGRYYHNATMLKGKIYVLGGSDPRKEEAGMPSVCSDVWSFDPNSGEWAKEPNMKTGRKNFGIVTFHGQLYVVGGQDSHGKILASVEKFDPSRGTWEEVNCLPEPRVSPAVCRFEGMIWVAGGMGSRARHAMSSQVYCFDPQQNMWVRKPSLRCGRGFAVLVSNENALYIVGGAVKEGNSSVSNDTIDMWDEKNSKWKLVTYMTIPRHSHTVSCIGSNMIIMGGTTTKYMKSLKHVEAWCLKTGAWNKQIAQLPLILTGHASVTLPPGTQISLPNQTHLAK